MEEKILTEEELNTVVEVLTDAAEENKDTQAIRAITNPEEDSEPIVLDESVETLSKYSNSTSEDIITILNIKNRLAQGEKFNIFNALPEAFRNAVLEEARKMGMVGNKKFLNILAREAIKSLIAEANIEKEFQLLQNEMQKLSNIPSINDAYLENLREMMETKLLAEADKKLAEGDAAKAEDIRNVSEAFTKSYTYKDQLTYLTITDNIISTIAKYYNKEKKFKLLMEDFDFTLGKSAIKTKNMMKDAYETLISLKLDVGNLDYRYFCTSFITITCLLCRNKDYTNPVDVTFMYYTLTILCSLKYTQNNIGLAEEVIKHLIHFGAILNDVYKKETEV